MKIAKQGHPYLFAGVKVLALENGAQIVRVAQVLPDHFSSIATLGPPFRANVEFMEALPVRYCGGEIR